MNFSRSFLGTSRMPLAISVPTAPTWGAIGFVVLRAAELLVREQHSHAVPVHCPAVEAPERGPFDWATQELAVCQARVSELAYCAAPEVEAESGGEYYRQGLAGTAAGSLFTLLLQAFFRYCWKLLKGQPVEEEDAADERSQVHRRGQLRRRVAGVIS